MRIRRILATKINNSRGEPTIKINVNGFSGAAPSGASTGKYEAKAYYGSVDASVKRANRILKKYIGFNFNKFEDLKKIKLPNNFGANPRIAFEFALLNALAYNKKLPLWKILNPEAKKFPRILANVIGGGAHYHEKSIDIQEILLSPKTKSIRKDVALTNLFHRELGRLLKTSIKTDENAWVAPEFLNIDSIFEIAFSVSGYERGIDMAASQIYKNKKYHWRNFFGKRKNFTSKEQFDVIRGFIENYGLFYIEDPFNENDFKSFARLRRKFPDVMICGDDLTATNLTRLKKAVKMRSINAIIIKPNQAGSLIKTKQVFDFAIKKDITPIISHRSGETLDATIAQLAFAWQAPYVKFGIAGKERLAKLTELIRIEKSFKSDL